MDPSELAGARHLAGANDDEPSPSILGTSVLTTGGRFARLFERFSQIGVQQHLIETPTRLVARIEDVRGSREEYVPTAICKVLAQLEEDRRLAACSHDRDQGARNRQERVNRVA
jgi:hypothetical protein